MSVWCSRSGISLFTTLLMTITAYAFPNDTINEIPDSYLTLASGNSLWTDLILNCKKPSLRCIQKNVYEYLHGVLNSKDIQLTDGIRISRNSANFSGESTAKTDDDDDFEDAQVGRSSSFGDVVAALHNNLVKFMVTHDFEFDLPEVFFEGATLQLSPRAFEKDGALVKVDLVPKKEVAVPEGRILFKKIKKFISEKLVIALLAIVLVIKLIAVKFLFMLPMIMGVAAAKKLLLKVLLFLFPVLSHLFKLCPYYSPTKYHQHNHPISHIHHLPPSLHHGPHDLEHLHHDHGHHHDSSNFEYYSDGPSFSDYHRKTFDAKGKKPAEENEVGWGSGQGQPFKRGTKFSPATANRPLTPSEIENMIQKAEQEATLKARLQEEQKRVENENKRLQDQIKQSLKLQEKLKLQSIIVKQNSKLVAANILQSANVVPTHVIPTQHVVHAVPAATYLHPPMVQAPNHPVYHHEASSLYSTVEVAYDQFYSPILEKMDKILIEMGYNDEPCRERIICSMYKNPTKYSPHSNLLSAELSRDPSELQKPTSSNAAVVRFYTYVQAARDGQDNRDCIRLYPSCPINTEL